MMRKLSSLIALILSMSLVACHASSAEMQPSKKLGGQFGQIPATVGLLAPSQTADIQSTQMPLATEGNTQAVSITPTSVPPVDKISAVSPSTVPPIDTSTADTLVSDDMNDQPEPVSSAASPRIISFTVSPEHVNPGDTVTLSWQTVGSKAELVECLHLSDHPCVPKEYLPLSLEGTRSVTIPEDARYNVQFIIVAKGDVEDDAVYQNEIVSVACPATWFFEGSPDPEVSCPEEAVIDSQAAMQTFEHGSMMWISFTNAIHIFWDDGMSRIITDQWTSSMPEKDPDITPPDGFYQPVRGFGLVWREQRDTLGWATAPEFSFDVTYQCSVYTYHNLNCYYRDPYGRIIATDFFGSWKVIKQ